MEFSSKSFFETEVYDAGVLKFSSIYLNNDPSLKAYMEQTRYFTYDSTFTGGQIASTVSILLFVMDAGEEALAFRANFETSGLGPTQWNILSW